MNNQEIAKQAQTFKPGDVIEIEPLDTLPNFDRKITIDSVGKECFYYGATETSDGHSYPFWAIKSMKKAEA